MKTATLAGAIARDLLAERRLSPQYPECFACGRTYVPKPPSGDDSTRFCSVRCREAFDAGFPPLDPAYHLKTNQRWYSLPLGRHGFLIECAGCSKTFDSRGLRCCSTECERTYRQRQQNQADLAEIGMEIATKRKCEACGGNIPNWRNGRRVSKATRFCSSQCGQRARKALGGLNRDQSVQTAKKCPSNGPSRGGS
jgi:hypothetical protein